MYTWRPIETCLRTWREQNQLNVPHMSGLKVDNYKMVHMQESMHCSIVKSGVTITACAQPFYSHIQFSRIKTLYLKAQNIHITPLVCNTRNKQPWPFNAFITIPSKFNSNCNIMRCQELDKEKLPGVLQLLPIDLECQMLGSEHSP